VASQLATSQEGLSSMSGGGGDDDDDDDSTFLPSPWIREFCSAFSSRFLAVVHLHFITENGM
jgi:hypothetical protein